MIIIVSKGLNINDLFVYFKVNINPSNWSFEKELINSELIIFNRDIFRILIDINYLFVTQFYNILFNTRIQQFDAKFSTELLTESEPTQRFLKDLVQSSAIIFKFSIEFGWFRVRC